jgi:hypothetical protein
MKESKKERANGWKDGGRKGIEKGRKRRKSKKIRGEG